jgi:hypothetical protein
MKYCDIKYTAVFYTIFQLFVKATLERPSRLGRADLSVAELPPQRGATQLRHQFLNPISQQLLRKYNDARACYLVPKIAFTSHALTATKQKNGWT